MVEPATKLKAPRSWKEYQKLPEGERWEIIGGEPFPKSTRCEYAGGGAQAASLGSSHQRVLLALAVELNAFFTGKLPIDAGDAPLSLREKRAAYRAKRKKKRVSL
ncbi:MAG TPA: hypothetical protein DCZ95_05155 [Verrucomicrobia bacterium]|nr:MAG: hypothetical protein A2X46_01880 [Lentisphaerae bacterium GWF2_57_35]HBA83465.1 hypothetical protein [Verrucomicrobiota bacterium]